MIKSIVRHILETKSTEEIIDKIKDYPYVSFDIFDTLLKRNVSNPSDVFKIVADKIHDESFYDARIFAEKEAHKTMNTEEVSLDDIYSQMESKFQQAKDIEMKLERDLSVENKYIFPIYEYCRQKGKKIVATSDMYLPHEFVLELLKINGYEIDTLFLSSDYGVQKVNGRLFRVLLKKLKITSADVIHIGDNFKADYLGSRKAGIKSVLIPRCINRYKFCDLKKKNNQVNVFINNTLQSDKSFAYQFGYSCFGPMMYGLVDWIHRHANNRKIVFFARDGYLVKKVYDQLYQQNNDLYLYVSRRSLSVPLLWKHHSWGDFFSYIATTRFFKLATFIKRLGLDPDNYKKDIKKHGLTLDYVINGYNLGNDKNVKAFYEDIENDVIQNSKKEYRTAILYLKEMRIVGDVIAFDIGWNGSIQRFLEELLDLAGIDANIEGYYLGVKNYHSNQCMNGYLFTPEKRDEEAAVSMMLALVEMLFLAKHGSTEKYREEKEFVEPQLLSPDFKENSHESYAIENIQQGAIDFCSRYHSLPYRQELSPGEMAFNLYRLGNMPSNFEAKYFGEFIFNDTDIIKMASPKHLSKYIQCPRQFLVDYSMAPWKAGFLKRLMPNTILFNILYNIGVYVHKSRKMNR